MALAKNPFDPEQKIEGIRYSKEVAERFGIKEAIVLQFIAFNSTKHKRDSGGRWWFFHSITRIADHYRLVISRSAVHRIIQKLIKANVLLVQPNRVRRTSSYAFVEDAMRETCLGRNDPIYFDIDHAREFGIAEAVIINNLSYWIIRNKEAESDYKYHPVKVAPYSRAAGMNRYMVVRALESLIQRKVLVEKEGSYGFVNEYKFIELRTKGYLAHHKRVTAVIDVANFYMNIPSYLNCAKWDNSVQNGTTIIDRNKDINSEGSLENLTSQKGMECLGDKNGKDKNIY